MVYTNPPTYVVCPQNQYLTPRAQFPTYDAEDIFELQNRHDQALSLDHLLGIQKQSAFEESEEPEPKYKERAMTVSNLTGNNESRCLRKLNRTSSEQQLGNEL
jgi:hypothetical protein